MQIVPVDLSSFGLLKITGIDAKKLLQGQLTCDMEKVTPTTPCLSAHCNPQGRVLSLFYVMTDGAHYYLYMLRSMILLTITALKKYALFYKVQLTDASEELASIRETMSDIINHWHVLSPENMTPTLYPETTGLFLPHEIHLDQLNAISFEKGCYTGQEIIARMHYRGKLKNHLYRAKIQSITAPTPGEAVYFQCNQVPKPCGTVVDLYYQAYHHSYDVLIVVEEAMIHHALFLTADPRTFFVIQ